MDTKTTLLPAMALGIGLLSSPVMAEPVVLSEAQMDRVAAGASINVDVSSTNINTNINTNITRVRVRGDTTTTTLPPILG